MRKPTRDDPGLYVYAPAGDERRPEFPPSASGLELTNCVPEDRGDVPRAAYACHCGKTAEATGAGQVQGLVKSWDDHGKTCPDKTDRPWERHGMPLPPRKGGRP